MYPFWNHILANQADLSMCVLKSCGMSAVCTWGVRGIFFQTCTFRALLSQCCVLLCGGHLSYVEYHMYRTNSNTPNFLLKYKLRAYFWPSATIPPGGVYFFVPPSTTPHNSIAAMNSHLRVTKLHFSISAIEFTSPPCHLELKRPPQRQRSLL